MKIIRNIDKNSKTEGFVILTDKNLDDFRKALLVYKTIILKNLTKDNLKEVYKIDSECNGLVLQAKDISDEEIKVLEESFELHSCDFFIYAYNEDIIKDKFDYKYFANNPIFTAIYYGLSNIETKQDIDMGCFKNRVSIEESKYGALFYNGRCVFLESTKHPKFGDEFSACIEESAKCSEYMFGLGAIINDEASEYLIDNAHDEEYIFSKFPSLKKFKLDGDILKFKDLSIVYCK